MKVSHEAMAKRIEDQIHDYFRRIPMNEKLREAIKLTIAFLDDKMDEGPRQDIAAASNLLEELLNEKSSEH